MAVDRDLPGFESGHIHFNQLAMSSNSQTRISKLFQDPSLEWIRKKLRERIRQGKGLQGSITHADPNAAETTAFANLLGNPSRPRKRLSYEGHKIS